MEWFCNLSGKLRHVAAVAVLGLLTAVFACFLPTPSLATDFTARQIGDFGNVTVMQVAGNYDADLPDGTTNSDPRKVIAREFYKTHKDEYDFLVIFSDFEFKMPSSETVAFYLPIKNDVQGIGQELFDKTSFFGSAGKLQGTVDMGNLANNVADPLDPRFEHTLGTLNHEVLHRWGAFLKLRDASGNLGDALLGKDGDHWSYLFDTRGSLHYGSRWQDNGDGTFTAVETRTYFSPLDLYLMGMLDKSDVPPMLLIENATLDQTKIPLVGQTISGTPRTVTIDEIVAANGERIPAAAEAQKSFKAAFVFVTATGVYSQADLRKLENVRNGFLTRFSVLTDGQGLVQVAPAPKEELASNPGLPFPVKETRELPPSIDEGMLWLKGRQSADGYWSDSTQTVVRDTTASAVALGLFAGTATEVGRAAGWLALNADANTDFLARKVETLANAGADAAALLTELVARQNADGGWGSGRYFLSNPADTALTLRALAAAGFANRSVLDKGMAYLAGRQNADGGWSETGAPSLIQPTANALLAFNAYRGLYAFEAAIGKGSEFLRGKQNLDGGFGNSPSTVYDTATTLLALTATGGTDPSVTRGVDYLLAEQSADGSWYRSPYQTAMAVQAVWRATAAPDLAIAVEDIRFLPEKITTLPTQLVLEATVRNLGRIDVPQAKVALYKDGIAETNKIDEQTVAFPGQAETVVTFAVSVTDGNEHVYTVVVDAGGQIEETSEENNLAVKAIGPEATYDFTVAEGGVSISQSVVDYLQSVTVRATVANHGTQNAYDVPIRFYVSRDGQQYVLANLNIDIPAGGTATRDMTWTANIVGNDLPLTVEVDAGNRFAENDEANNAATTVLTVNDLNLTDPNLSVAGSEVSMVPNPVVQGEPVRLSAVIRNDGFASAGPFAVEFFRGNPEQGGALLATQEVAQLSAAGSVTVEVDSGFAQAGEQYLFVRLDHADAVHEISEADNLAFLKVNVLSHADLSVKSSSIVVSPRVPREGDQVAIAVTVENRGDLDAAGVVLDLAVDGEPFGSQTIALIHGHAQATTTFMFDSAGKAGDHTLAVTVDAIGQITEGNEANNNASATLTIRQADLRLTEPYFSPNGDGVKDSTQFTFTLAAPETVRVVIVNEDGQVVRIFSGPELEQATAGTITWDGLDEAGQVADDGTYSIQVRRADETVISEALVVIDNNNAPFIASMDDPKVQANDLSCMMPAETFKLQVNGFNDRLLTEGVWLPNGRGILFYVPWSQANTSPEKIGFFIMSVDGKFIQQVLYSQMFNGVIGQPEHFAGFNVSDDGEKVAFVLKKYKKFVNNYGSDSYDIYSSEVWSFNIDGTNLQLISVKNNSDSNWSNGHTDGIFRTTIRTMYIGRNPLTLKWSSDGKSIAFLVNWWIGYGSTYYTDRNNQGFGQDLITVNIETKEEIIVYHKISNTIDGQSGQAYGKIEGFSWRPEKNQLVVFESEPNKGRCCYWYAQDWLGWKCFDGSLIFENKIWLVDNYLKDSSISKKLIKQFVRNSDYDYDIRRFRFNYASGFNTEWLSNDKLLLVYDKHYSQYDKLSSILNVDNGDEITIGNPNGIVISSDKKKIFVSNDNAVIDVELGTEQKTPLLHFNNQSHIELKSLIKFSKDNKKLLYRGHRDGTISIDGSDTYLFIYDIEGQKFHDISLFNDFYYKLEKYSWLANSEYVAAVVDVYGETEGGTKTSFTKLYLVDVTDGKFKYITNVSSNYYLNNIFGVPLLGINNNKYDNIFAFMDVYAGSKYSDDIADPECKTKEPLHSQEQSLWTLSSGNNLVAKIYPYKEHGQITLRGTADDLNFAGYSIEYAEAGALESWYPIISFAETPVNGGEFTTWSPPGQGSYYVRLTVWDKAGNVARDRKRVTWAEGTASVSGFYKTAEVFSPNGDGVKDSVELRYRVNSPVYLQFEIFDQNGNLVRSFAQSHPSAGNAAIVWDGRDEAGLTVADGTYRIHVLNYDFHVTVDTTRPHIALKLGFEGTKASLSGHAFDASVEKWTIAYGEGENPNEWVVVDSGGSNLVKRDISGDMWPDPLVDFVITTYASEKLPWLTGKKFKLSMQDKAGNSASVVTGYLDEVIWITSWDFGPVSGQLSPAMVLPGIPGHEIGGIETIRLSLDRLTFQYRLKNTWHDLAETVGNNDGAFAVRWLTDSTISSDLTAVRFKGVDLAGRTLYSNLLTTSNEFSLKLDCSGELSGENYLMEQPGEIRLQMLPAGASSWIDYRVYTGTAVPSGSFTLPRPTDVQIGEGTSRLRMVTSSGRTSNEVSWPLACPGSVSLSISYPKVDCGELSGKAIIEPNIKGEKISPLSIAYTVIHPDGTRTADNVDLTRQPGTVELDLAGMVEGNHSISASLRYRDDTGVIREATAQESMVVDFTPPRAAITYPTGGPEMLCPLTMDENGETWLGLPFEGVVADNTRVKEYKVFYALGEDSSSWQPLPLRRYSRIATDNTGSMSGQLGVLDVSTLQGSYFSLKLEVTDLAGNVSCHTVSFMLDREAPLAGVTVGGKAFSPNGDGIADAADVAFTLGEPATVTVQVLKEVVETVSVPQCKPGDPKCGEPLPDPGCRPGDPRCVPPAPKTVVTTEGSSATSQPQIVVSLIPVRTLETGVAHGSGTNQIPWDGLDNGEIRVPDGRYRVVVTAQDSCGNNNTAFETVLVDSTAPVAVITVPYQQQTLISNLVEIRGTANDGNLGSYRLEAGEGIAPAAWTLITSSETAVVDGVLGVWNTFDLTGVWTLRLTAVDTAGNRAETNLQVVFGQKPSLIKTLTVEPAVFSPNSDAAADATTVRYELMQPASTTLQIVNGGQAVRTLVSSAPAAGIVDFNWDGRDENGQLVVDGNYTVRLLATAANDVNAMQIEEVSLSVDTKGPAMVITSPVEGAFLAVATPVVFGSISDSHLSSYTVRYSGANALEELENGNQNRTNYVFGSLAQVGEGDYLLLAEAQDSAGNITTLQRGFKVDHSPPVVTISEPAAGAVFNSTHTAIAVSGLIQDSNLVEYAIRYGVGANPWAWNDLANVAAAVSGNFSYSWDISQLADSSDGKYTLLISAKDKAGAIGQAKVIVEMDRQLPNLALSNLAEGDYISTPRSLVGTVADANLVQGMFEQAQGSCASAAAWAPLRLFDSTIQDAVLFELQELPPDGPYCARLWAEDRAGNRQELLRNFSVDTHPPAVPQLSGRLEGKQGVVLEWPANNESDLAGYDLYRNGSKLNTAPLMANGYQDLGLAESRYVYTLKAVDRAGNSSADSEPQTFVIDVTPPVLRILSPKAGDFVSDVVKISGTAYSTDDFKEYRVYVGTGSAPPAWTLVRRSPAPVNFGTLYEWDTIGLTEGVYAVKLEAEDLYANTAVTQIAITLDNTLPAPPLLANPAVSGSNVTLSWTVEASGDLAGYLLFRNGQLVNYSGAFTTDYGPYLIKTQTYLDAGVPDGTYPYVVVAVDRAGNMSDQSNTVEVVIETKAPAIEIVDPKFNTSFSDKVLITTKSPDNDVNTVLFQYRGKLETLWHDLSGPVAEQPFEAEFAPAVLGLNYGPYYLRAIATDASGHTGVPSADRYVYYLLPAPHNGTAVIDGRKVKLSWNYGGEEIPSRYRVNRRMVGYSPSIVGEVSADSFADENVPDGTYYYSIYAIDSFGTPGPALEVGPVQMFAPVLDQPFTPTADETIAVAGSGAPPYAQVKVTNDTLGGMLVSATVSADADGKFSFTGIALASGENRLSAVATDEAGNVRISDPSVVVRAAAPSAPTGLNGVVSGHDVALSWDLNGSSEQVIGYLVYRDGERLNGSSSIATADLTSSWDSYSAYQAFDQNLLTYWQTQLNIGQQWIELDLPSTEPVARVEIQWDASAIGKDFSVQAWTGNGWLTLKSLAGNGAETVSVDIQPSYITDKIRILLTASNDPSSYRYVRIKEIELQKDDLTAIPGYEDPDLGDKEYAYSLRAVNNLGLVSEPSPAMALVVGDVIPPAAPTSLVASAVLSTVQLDWSLTPNNEPDLAGYIVYRHQDGGWERLNSSLITGTSYADLNLSNDTYSYQISAIDLVGNESDPSPVSEAVVAATGPPIPQNLSVSAVPEGSALALSWGAVVGAAQFQIYRSSTSGGPYDRVTGASQADNFYTDAGLANGQTYYYVATSVDAAGNESDFSAEASGTAADVIAPAAPEFMFPARNGEQTVTITDSAQVAGLAEPGSTVTVYQNGILTATVPAAFEETRDFKAAGLARQQGAISPDGSKLGYVNEKQLIILDLTSNEVTTIASYVSNFAWSPKGDQIAYQQSDSGLYYSSIYVYDLGTRVSARISNNSWVIESCPSWSMDGTKLVFAEKWGGIYVKNLVSGELTQLVNGPYITWPKLSPDGAKILFFQSGSLYFHDFASGETRLIDYYTDEVSLAWSVDGRQFAYVSHPDSTYVLTAYDLESQAKRQVISGTSILSSPTWSSDGLSLAFGETGSSSQATIRVADSQGTIRVVEDNLLNLQYLYWRPTGELQIVDSKGAYVISPAGSFKTQKIALDAGENVFYAFAEDASGNRSSASEGMAVIHDVSQLPDLAIARTDISVYPASPLPGGKAIGHVVLRNPSNTPVANVNVAVYLWSSDGQLDLLDEVLISQVPAQSSQSFSVPMQVGVRTGLNRIIVVVDPDDAVEESVESNNYATREFTVAERTGIDLISDTDHDAYASNESLIATVKVECFAEEQISIEFKIEDGSGNVVEELDRLEETLLPGLSTYNYAWNTGTVLAGSYKLHVTVRNGSGEITETYSDFSILPDIDIKLDGTTDKPNYGANETVQIGASIAHNGWNVYLENLRLTLSIFDSGNSLISSEARTLGTLFPRTSSQPSVAWNTGLTAPGTYRVIVDASVNEQLLASDEVIFVIEPQAIISGAITSKSEIVLAGADFVVGHLLKNSGNAGTSGILQASIVDPKSFEVLATEEQSLSLPQGAEQSGEFTFSSQGLPLQGYKIVLRFMDEVVPKAIGSASFTLKDGTPPEVTIWSPRAGEICESVILLDVRVADNASGVARVEYQIDEGEWLALPPADPAAGRYSLVLDAAANTGGLHRVRFRAFDRAENSTESSQVEFEVQTDRNPPVTMVEMDGPAFALASGATFISGQTMIGLSAVDDLSGTERTEYRIDNGPWQVFSGKFTFVGFAEGEHRLGYRSADYAGNIEEEKEVLLIFDQTAPVVDITFDNEGRMVGESFLVTAETEIALDAADTLSGVRAIEYRLDEESSWRAYAGAFRLTDQENGNHTIHYRGTDNVENTEEGSVAVTLATLEVATEILNLPRVLIWTRDPAEINGSGRPTYSIEDVRAVVTEAFAQPDAYFTLITEKEAFKTELRTGIYNIVMILDQDFPFDAVFLRELREAVHRGTGLLVSHWQKSVDPILQDVFGLDFSGSMAMHEGERSVVLFQSPLAVEQSTMIAGRVLKTRLAGGILAGVIAAESTCEGLRSLAIDYGVDLKTGDWVRVSLSVPQGNKLNVIDEEQMTVVSLPAGEINRAFGNTMGDLAIASATAQGLTLTISAPYGYMEPAYSLAVTIDRADGTRLASGPVAITSTCSANLNAGMVLGPFVLQRVEEDRIRTGDDLPAVVLNEYGKGKTAFFVYDLLSAAVSGVRPEQLAMLHRAATYLLPGEAALQAGGVSLLETRFRIEGAALELKAVEKLGAGLTHLPAFTLIDAPLEYARSVADGQETSYRYFVKVADYAGTYGKETEVLLARTGGCSLLDRYAFSWSIDSDSASLMQRALSWVEEQAGIHPEAAPELTTIREALSMISGLPRSTKAEVESLIHQLVQTIHQTNHLPFDTSGVRTVLSEYLRIAEASGNYP